MDGETSQRHALVLGASGITGWAIVNSILHGYPTKDVFAKVTAVTNRPLSHNDSLWPEDPRLQMVAGIDLLAGDQSELEALISEKIPSVETISHLYFYAYQQNDDSTVECEVNKKMLERAVLAIENLSSRLEFVVLPSGTKIYGVHMLDKFPFADILPIKETAPPLPEPWINDLFYYDQIASLKKLSTGKKWTWCEIRPDNIIGFVPNNNYYSLAQTLALYLSLYAYNNPPSTACPFPGSTKSWNAQYNETPQDMVARFSIHASLHPDKTGGKSFNCAGEQTSWSVKWPIICSYFCLEGTPPEESTLGPSAYLKEHQAQWDKMASESELRKGFVGNNLSHPYFQHFIMTLLDFDRQMDMGAMNATGYEELIKTKECWSLAFDRMKKAKIIP